MDDSTLILKNDLADGIGHIWIYSAWQISYVDIACYDYIHYILHWLMLNIYKSQNYKWRWTKRRVYGSMKKWELCAAKYEYADVGSVSDMWGWLIKTSVWMY